MSPEVEHPHVKVTLDVIYDTLLTMQAQVAPLPDRVDDHEVRIRAIEKYLWIWIGASGLAGAGVASVVQSWMTP